MDANLIESFPLDLCPVQDLDKPSELFFKSQVFEEIIFKSDPSHVKKMAQLRHASEITD